MRFPRTLASFSLLISLLISIASVACTTETVTSPNDGAGGDEGGDGDGSGAPGGDSSGPCAPAEATKVLQAKVLGSASVAFAGDRLGFAYVGASGAPTLEVFDQDTDAPRKTVLASTVKYQHYGAGYITTSLASNGDTFGFGWYTERPFQSTDGVWSTAFATVSGADGSKSAATPGNADHGRGGTDDMVQASHPSVMALGDGFLLAWSDLREKEPTATGVNLAGWGGIYARAYDAEGNGAASDVQIAQPTGMDAFAGVSDGDVAMPIWANTDEDTGFTEEIHARPASTFTPASEPAPAATFENHASHRALGAARGANGDVLVVADREDADGKAHAGALTLTSAGKAKAKYADFPEEGLSRVAVAATASGWVVAAFESASAGASEFAPTALRIFWLDADGKRVGEATSALSIGDDVEVSGPALRVSGDAVTAAFAVRAAGASSGAANAATDTSVYTTVACAARAE
jgi:hypothetical protein